LLVSSRASLLSRSHHRSSLIAQQQPTVLRTVGEPVIMSLCKLLLVMCFSVMASSKKGKTRTKQYNLFNMEGVTAPNIISNTTLLSAKNNQLTLLSMALSSKFNNADWFFGSVQNIPKFIEKARQDSKKTTTSCQLRLLALGHYSSFFRKKKVHVYEGGLATLRIKFRQQHVVTLSCYYVTGRNQHFVLVVRIIIFLSFLNISINHFYLQSTG
jgi:hypothetical protein